MAVFVATRAEAGPLWKALCSTSRAPDFSDPVARARLQNREVILATTGMGPEHAEAAATRLFDELPGVVAFSVGVSAGLDHRVRPGDLIIADQVRFCRPNAGPSRLFSCDSGLSDSAVNAVRRSGDRCHRGPILTVDRIVVTAAEKQDLAARWGGLAVDMESGAIASAAASRAVPFLALRAVLDPVEQDLRIGFDRFLDRRGEPHPGRLARYLLAHPHALIPLVGLGFRTKAACRRLGHVLSRL
jgi:nucleoside phosphorylase